MPFILILVGLMVIGTLLIVWLSLHPNGSDIALITLSEILKGKRKK